MCDIEINGVKYRKKEQPKKKSMSKTMDAMLMMASAFEYVNPYSTPKNPKEQPKIDIIKEYGLIQQKRSNLSRSQRDWVVYRFNMLYTKI